MARLSVGGIGCGGIAQVQHLPHPRELDDQFTIGGTCDISAELLRRVGDDYGVPGNRRFADYRELLRSDIAAALMCTLGTHAPYVIAAAESGKHILVEKPACYAVREAEAMVSAAERAGVVHIVTYPKRYEPAYI